MTGFKKWFIALLLLSGNCFADTMFVKDLYFLYYLNAHTNGSEPTLYYGKYVREGDSFIEFSKLAEIEVADCPTDYKTRLICKINAFLQADKSNRAAMVKVLVDRPVMSPKAQMVIIALN